MILKDKTALITGGSKGIGRALLASCATRLAFSSSGRPNI